MKPDALMRLYQAWNDLENAMQRVETALPQQMTAAVARMEAERVRMRSVIQNLDRESQP